MGGCQTSSTTATTTTRTTTTFTSTTSTTTIYHFENGDCNEVQAKCTEMCELAADRNYTMIANATREGKACNGPHDCKPGEGKCPTTTSTVTTTTATSTTVTSTTGTSTTTTTTHYDPDNVDCIERQDKCTTACETAGIRNYRLIVAAVKLGRACKGANDCQPGERGCPFTTSTATSSTGTTTTTTTTTIYDEDNVDCVEEQSPCTVLCELASARNYTLLTAAVKNGKVCENSTDCQAGEGKCPTTSTSSSTRSSTTETSTTTFTSTTSTTVYDPNNVDCEEQQDECSKQCQTASERNYKVLVAAKLKGRACKGPTDCVPGEMYCPSTTSTATTTTVTTTTVSTTTVTTTTFDPDDCVEVYGNCTAACELAAERKHTVLNRPVRNGSVCAGPLSCQPGEGACIARPIPTDVLIYYDVDCVEGEFNFPTIAADTVKVIDEKIDTGLWQGEPHSACGSIVVTVTAVSEPAAERIRNHLFNWNVTGGIEITINGNKVRGRVVLLKDKTAIEPTDLPAIDITDPEASFDINFTSGSGSDSGSGDFEGSDASASTKVGMYSGIAAGALLCLVISCYALMRPYEPKESEDEVTLHKGQHHHFKSMHITHESDPDHLLASNYMTKETVLDEEYLKIAEEPLDEYLEVHNEDEAAHPLSTSHPTHPSRVSTLAAQQAVAAAFLGAPVDGDVHSDDEEGMIAVTSNPSGKYAMAKAQRGSIVSIMDMPKNDSYAMGDAANEGGAPTGGYKLAAAGGAAAPSAGGGAYALAKAGGSGSGSTASPGYKLAAAGGAVGSSDVDGSGSKAGGSSGYQMAKAGDASTADRTVRRVSTMAMPKSGYAMAAVPTNRLESKVAMPEISGYALAEVFAKPKVDPTDSDSDGTPGYVSACTSHRASSSIRNCGCPCFRLGSCEVHFVPRYGALLLACNRLLCIDADSFLCCCPLSLPPSPPPPFYFDVRVNRPLRRRKAAVVVINSRKLAVISLLVMVTSLLKLDILALMGTNSPKLGPVVHKLDIRSLTFKTVIQTKMITQMVGGSLVMHSPTQAKPLQIQTMRTMN
jgi:hypothetical protein